MLTGNDFIILSDLEARLIYDALGVTHTKSTYKKLQELGILKLIQDIERFLFEDEGED